MNTGTLLLYNPSIDLIMLLIAVVIDAILIIGVYLSNPKSATNIIFSLLTICMMLWLIITYVVRLPQFADYILIIHRLGIFFAAPMSLLFFLLAHTMPKDKILLSRRNFLASVGATILMMALNISPYAFTHEELVDGVYRTQTGPGLIPFSVISTIFSILALYWLIKKYRGSHDDIERKQVGIVLMGIGVMLFFVIVTLLIPVLVFNTLTLLPYTPLYTLVFLGMTAYAITKYRLFNIKVLLTEALTVTILVVLFAKVFGEESVNAQIVDSLVLMFTAIFGFFLVRSVKKEVEQRELIQKQEQELEVVNHQQEGLLHFISHEIKGYLTKNEAGFAAITEGDYGAVSEPLKAMAASALVDTRKGVETVMDILDASNLKKGTVAYDKKPFNFSAAVEDVVNSLKPMAEEKGLSLDYTDRTGGSSAVNGDENKLRRHVIRNLIDNSIRYTPSGNVRVELSAVAGTLRMTITDTGVGISAEDMKKLFTEGGHGADSIKVNVHSTGYGLYIAKSITEAHGGKIWAESEGAGKGARFIVELPAA